MAYETIAIRKLTPAIGAEVSGVDLASLSNQQASEVHDALMAHQVLFFRDQQMSVDQHKAFGRLFGELLVHPAARAHAWLAALPDPTGAAAKNAAMWNKDLDVPSADFATSNLYALYWLLAQARPTPPEQANTFARFAIFVQGKAWIGTRCLDITKVALVIGAPPRIENCK